METNGIIYSASVPVASNYKDGRPGAMSVTQFAGGASLVELSGPATVSQIHAHASELREFAAACIAAADALDALQDTTLLASKEG